MTETRGFYCYFFHNPHAEGSLFSDKLFLQVYKKRVVTKLVRCTQQSQAGRRGCPAGVGRCPAESSRNPRQGKTILDNAKADAAKLSEETVSRAQQDAQVWLENSRASCENECKAMAERSREKLTAAANLIAERIVNTL